MAKHSITFTFLVTQLVLANALVARGQATDASGNLPSFGSITTPHPINPATDTTNPSARATQSLNPYLGSASEEKAVEEEIKLSLADAIARGVKFNLGLIDSKQEDARVRAAREHVLATLLPQITARAEQSYQQLSYAQIGIKLPKSSPVQLGPTSGAFGYSQATIDTTSPIVSMSLLTRYKQQIALQQASLLNTKDARDVVVFTVGAAFFQVIASQARLATEQAAFDSAKALDRQVEDQFRSEVSPEIDSLRAKVELSTAKQRVVDAANDLEKDKLTLDRITGIPLAQRWVPVGDYGYALGAAVSDPLAGTSQSRFDLSSTRQEVAAAELGVKSARAERLPEVSFQGSYGGGGYNPANYNQVYLVQGNVSLPLFTSGRIRSDIQDAQATLARRQAEYRDLEGRVDYDIRTARLDVASSASAVQVARENRELADKALAQSQDRYRNDVTNYLEVLEAQQAQVAANGNYIASLFSFNVAKMSLARALGNAESHLTELFGTH
jgi:outer membrane protein TolC